LFYWDPTCVKITFFDIFLQGMARFEPQLCSWNPTRVKITFSIFSNGARGVAGACAIKLITAVIYGFL